MSVTGLAGVFGFHRQAGAGQPAKGPYNATGANSVQTITLSGATSGGYKLAFRDEVTATIAYDALASAVESAIEALNAVAGADVTVTGSAGGPYTVTWEAAGAWGGNAVGVTVHSDTLNAAGTVTVATTTAGGSWFWLPALSVNFQPNQIVQAIPAEVGGDLWSRGSYKGGVSGQGQVMFIPRGGLGLAELLLAFCGTYLTNTAVAATFAAKSANKLTGDGTNGLQVGAYKYRFTPQTGIAAELPWYTIIRNVGGKFVEEFADSRLGNFAFDIAATNLLQIDASFVSRACATLALTSGGSGSQQVGRQTAGNGRPFQSVDATVKLDTNVAGVESAVAADTDFNPTRLNIGFANQLSTNEFVVGSFFLQDITNLARTANVTYSVYLKNPDLYARTYAHGANIQTSDASWSSQIWKGAMELTMTGHYISGNSGDRFSIKVIIPEMDYMATPISLAGNNLVEYQLTTNVVLSQSAGVNPFEIEYVTNENIIY